MAGSLRPRLERGADAWELRVYLGRDAAGKVRQRSVLFRGSKRAAEKELARLVAEQDRAPAVVPDNRVPDDAAREWGPATTVNDAIEAWQANGWDDLSPSRHGATRACGGSTSVTRSAGAGSPASAPMRWSAISGS